MKTMSRFIAISLSVSLLASSALADGQNDAQQLRAQIHQKISADRAAWDALRVPQKRAMIFNEIPNTPAAFPNPFDMSADSFEAEVQGMLNDPRTSPIVKIAIYKHLSSNLEKMNSELNRAVLRGEVDSNELLLMGTLEPLFGFGFIGGMIVNTIETGSLSHSGRTLIYGTKYNKQLVLINCVAALAAGIAYIPTAEKAAEARRKVKLNTDMTSHLYRTINASKEFIRVLDSQMASLVDLIILEEAQMNGVQK